MPGLYIHIPYFLKRCSYCDFISGIYNPALADSYISALKIEISRLPNKHPISTLFIGGGTPTTLSTDQLHSLLNTVFQHFSFIENYEATIEANPGTLDIKKLTLLRQAGINRLSIGMQSFNDQELALLGRIHSSEEARRSIEIGREAGFTNIGIDLIYGLPGQTQDSWHYNLKTAVSLRPQHISAYELTFEKDTELSLFMKNPANASLISQDCEEEIIDMYYHAIDYLDSKGYAHYEISNFAKNDKECRHNLNYWDRGTCYAAGIGAHSFVDKVRSANISDINKYIQTFSQGNLPFQDPRFITDEEAFSEALFLGMRKTRGVCIESFAKRYKKNLLTIYVKEIKELTAMGLIEISASECSYESELRLTRRGLVLSNEVFERFI